MSREEADRYFQNTHTGICLYTLNPEVYKDICKEMATFADYQTKSLKEENNELMYFLREYIRLAEHELNETKSNPLFKQYHYDLSMGVEKAEKLLSNQKPIPTIKLPYKN